MKRYLEKNIQTDLQEKMVFVGGPRQVGKTTMALQLLNTKSKTHPAYLNWDILLAKKIIKNQQLPPDEKLVVFDEIHKFSRWRNLMKGYYDQYNPEVSFLVTGSARLDYYRRGGDSLLGRYHYYRLHPLSLHEIQSSSLQDVQHLLKYGGFPEPFLKGNETFHQRWQLERLHRVVGEDLRDLENVRDIGLIELLAEALPIRVGSPLSIQNLREDLSVGHDSVERWICMLENLYYCYRIAPFGSPKIRAVKKERKLYLWDWSQIEDSGPRFENFVASHLLKYCHYLEDTKGEKMELRFLRDIDKREVDFVVLRKGKPIFAVECKTGERSVSPAARYFKERTPIPLFYQVHLGQADFGSEKADVRVMPFTKFCKEVIALD